MENYNINPVAWFGLFIIGIVAVWFILRVLSLLLELVVGLLYSLIEFVKSKTK